MIPNGGAGFTGQASIEDLLTPFNAEYFMIWAILSRIATVSIVQVVGVTTAGQIGPPGLVDVRILVNLIDGAGNATPHGTIHQIPYFRLQGGTFAVILDPVIGDIGIAVFASRDISSVVSNAIANQATPGARLVNANPGSRRMLDYADGMYLGGVLNGIPTDFVQWSAAGIAITSQTALSLTAPDINLNAATVEINAAGSVSVVSPSFKWNGATVAVLV
jgi:hypothetical protein